MVEHSAARRGDRPGRGGRARRWRAARLHVRARLPRARRCAPSTRGSRGSCGACSSTTSRTPSCCRGSPSGDRSPAASRPGAARDRLHRGDDRPLLHPAVHGARGAAGVRARSVAAVALYTDESRDRVRDAVDFVELVSARTELRRAGPSTLRGPVPVPRRAHARRSGSTRRRRSTTASAARPPAMCSRSCRRPRGSTSRGRWSCSPTATAWSSSASRRIRARPSGAGAASGCSSCSSARPPTTSATCGSPTRRRRAREYLAGRGLGEEMLREFRVGYAPSAWDRVLMASRRGGLLRAGAVRDRAGAALAGERAALRPLPRADHVPAGRHPRPGARLRRARDARPDASGTAQRATPKYLNTSDNDVYHKGLPPVRRRPRARARGARRAR